MVTCPWGRGKPSYPDKAVPKADKEYIAWYASTHKGGQKHMMQVTGLGKNTIRKYQRYLKEGRPQAEGMGRQSEVRGSPARAIVKKVRKGREEGRSCGSDDITEMFIEAPKQSTGRKKDTLHREWVVCNLKKLNLTQKHAQEKSDARQEAERDILNALSTVVGFGLLARWSPTIP